MLAKLTIWAALPQALRGITQPIAARDCWTRTPLKQRITTAVFHAVSVARERQVVPAPILCSEPFGAPMFFHSVRGYYSL